MSSLLDELQTVFRDVFGDEGIVLRESTTAAHIEGWDSLAHINLVVAMEHRFGVSFSVAEIAGIRSEGRNVGDLVRLLARKLGRDDA